MLQPRRCILEEFPETNESDYPCCNKGHSLDDDFSHIAPKKKSRCNTCMNQASFEYSDDDSYFHALPDDFNTSDINVSCSDEVLAMVYVKSQKFNHHNAYDLSDALCYGTLFPELNKPFTGGNCDE